MPKILAIETSTEACSCALNLEGNIIERYEILPRQHANCLLPMIESLMEESSLNYKDLDAIAVGRGPGSFTGLRIAAGVTQGIAFGANLPVVPVSTLAALASQAHRETGNTNVFSCLDARINEVYWASYQFTEEEPILKGIEQLCKPEMIPASAMEASEGWYGAGNGLTFIDSMNADVQNSFLMLNDKMLPRAADIAFLANIYFEQGLFESASELTPVYIRDKVTHG